MNSRSFCAHGFSVSNEPVSACWDFRLICGTAASRITRRVSGSVLDNRPLHSQPRGSEGKWRRFDSNGGATKHLKAVGGIIRIPRIPQLAKRQMGGPGY